jgi:hypothetical protein
MIETAAPPLVHSARLEDELAVAGVLGATVILTEPSVGLLRVEGATEKDRATVETVVAAHAPPAESADADLHARIQAVHDDPNVSAGVKKLTAALLGLNGEAAVAGRPTDSR